MLLGRLRRLCTVLPPLQVNELSKPWRTGGEGIGQKLVRLSRAQCCKDVELERAKEKISHLEASH
jgi:hypothetical protein